MELTDRTTDVGEGIRQKTRQKLLLLIKDTSHNKTAPTDKSGKDQITITLDVQNIEKLHAVARVRDAATSGKLYRLPVDKKNTAWHTYCHDQND